MTLPYNRNLKERSRELRNQMTKEEKILWEYLRGKKLGGYGFVRQKPIGNYIVDFYCRTAKLVIEIDSGGHFTEEGKEYDVERDAFLRGLDLTVLHFPNSQISNNVESVLNRILKELPDRVSRKT